MLQIIAVAEPWKVFETGKGLGGALLIDVRSRSEFTNGHARGAVSLPVDEINIDRIEMIAGAKAGRSGFLYLICESGLRSEQAAHKLARLGFDKVCVVAGGTQAWRADGLPMSRPSGWWSVNLRIRLPWNRNRVASHPVTGAS